VIKKYGWLLILAVAIFWRFGDFGNRWVLNQDQARDAIISLYANRNGLIPEIGSPSSAGPFNFGPWYDWMIMFWEKVIPTVNGPWIGFGIMSVMSVMFYYLTGGWIAGILAAVAVGLVENSPDMLNTVIVGWSAALAWWATKKLTDTDNWKWGILVGFGVGLSINFHFQSWGLLAIPLVIFLINKFDLRKRIGWGLAMAGGLLMAFLPLIIFDLKRNGVWVKSVIEYYTVGVNKFYVPVRWLTELRDFWPRLLGSVTVGVESFGYVWLILGGIILITNYKLRITNLKKINRFWLIVGLVFLIQIVLMRNYRGVRSREYLIAFHGMIILICLWIVAEWYKLNKYFGFFILGVVVVLAGVKNWQNIKQYPSQAKIILEIKKELDSKISGQIEMEQYQESDMVSMPLFYLYYRENRIGDQNKISICDGNKYACPNGEFINNKNYRIYLGSQNWDKLTPENIYGRLMVNYEPIIVATEGKYVTVVNPVRSRELWKDKSLKPIEDQYGAINNLGLKATWLIQNDVLDDQELINKIKNFDQKQELGVFLEISKNLADKSRIYFDEQRPWYDPGVVFLSGYSQSERKRLIDTMMNDFKTTFGYLPKSAGAWWIDGISQQYLENKYGIKTIMIVADQKTTDNYGVWGQWWGVPYHPDPKNILVPGNSKTVVIQWAQRDLEKAYAGVGPKISNYSDQANDYTSLGLDINYFKKLANIYLEAGQLTVGLETGMESVGQEMEYEKQLKWLVDNKIKSVTMSEFSDIYGSKNPEKVTLGEWVLTPEYRENKTLGERTDYLKGMVFKDYFDKDEANFLNRVYTKNNLVDSFRIPWMGIIGGILLLLIVVSKTSWRILMPGLVVLMVGKFLRYSVVNGERLLGVLVDSFRFVGISNKLKLVNQDFPGVVARSMLKIEVKDVYFLIWIVTAIIISLGVRFYDQRRKNK
jgi:hypothetical protein